MSTLPQRDFTVVFGELCHLTNQMAEQRHNPDFLIEGIGKRQGLMDEYDILTHDYPRDKAAFEQDAAVREKVVAMLSMDAAISKALEEHKSTAHKEVAGANAQKRVLDYLGKAQPLGGGSLMDYKK